RYEWRAFAMDFGIVEQRLRSRGQLLKIRRSRELYLLPPVPSTLSIKLSDHRLSIKKQLRCRAPLQRWSPSETQPLPLTTQQIRRLILRPFDLPDSLNDGSLADTDSVTQALLQHTDLLLVPVTKRRWVLSLRHCDCDVAELTINNTQLLSIGLSAESPEPVLALAERLGLNRWHNRDYTRFLRQVTGLDPVPVEEEWCWEP
ncbi:MAG: hypothetical protein R3296_09195, partial [Oleiphilaceae bacterium]|nr:hypothetical protein [Oleiphilaceae bacterium]